MTGLVGRIAGSLAIASAPAAQAQDVTPPKAYTTTPGGINVSDGSLVYSVTDLSMGPLTLERYHRSGIRQPNYGMFGYNFSSNFDIFVVRRMQAGTTDPVTVHIGNTASGTYTQSDSNPSSIFPNNLDAEKGRLTWNGSQYVYQDSSGTTYTFSASVTADGAVWEANSRRVERIDFPDGRRQTFSYTAAGRPKLVEDSSGYAIVFDYNTNNDVSAACIFKRSETYVSATSTCTGAPIKTSYGYTYVTARNLLTSATDVTGKITNYTQVYNFGVTCIKPPGFTNCTVSQTGNIDPEAPTFSVTQTLADGGVWKITGMDSAPEIPPRGDDGAPAPYDGHLEVTVTDPDNQVTRLTFTKSSPYGMRDPLLRGHAFRFEGGVPIYDPWTAASYGSMLREATYPDGDKYEADYGGPFRSITKERHVSKDGVSFLEKEYGYQSCTVSPGTYQNCAKPIWIDDPTDNRTNYTYASHGGVLTEMLPAPVASGARPLKVTTWVQRYAWLKNANTLVQAPVPVWVKKSETQCQTVAGANPAATCDTAAPQTVTTYEYGANNAGQSLLVKAVVVTAGGTSLRTCYGYDAFDRKIYETQPNANLTNLECASVAP